MFNVDDIISDGISEVKIVSIDKKNKYYNITNGEIENDAHICNWVIYFKDQEKWKLVKSKDNKKHSQPKQEWSKEDAYNHHIILALLNNECVGYADKRIAIEWFKSFRPKNRLFNLN